MPLSEERWRVAEVRGASAVLNRCRGLHWGSRPSVGALSGEDVDPVEVYSDVVGEGEGTVKSRDLSIQHYVCPRGGRPLDVF